MLMLDTVVSSAIVDKYIGESARLIREMFGYAKEHEPCIIFMDEIDAIAREVLGIEDEVDDILDEGKAAHDKATTRSVKDQAIDDAKTEWGLSMTPDEERIALALFPKVSSFDLIHSQY